VPADHGDAPKVRDAGVAASAHLALAAAGSAFFKTPTRLK